MEPRQAQIDADVLLKLQKFRFVKAAALGILAARFGDFFFKHLFGRDIAQEEVAFYVDAAKVFTASGFKAKSLVKYLVTSEAYCAR